MALSTRVILEISWEVPKSLRRCEILIDEPLKIPFPKICKQAFSRNPGKSPGKSCSQEFLGIISHGDYMFERFFWFVYNQDHQNPREITVKSRLTLKRSIPEGRNIRGEEEVTNSEKQDLMWFRREDEV